VTAKRQTQLRCKSGNCALSTNRKNRWLRSSVLNPDYNDADGSLAAMTNSSSDPHANSGAEAPVNFSRVGFPRVLLHPFGMKTAARRLLTQGQPSNSIVFEMWPEATTVHRTAFANLSKYRLPIAGSSATK
jgi:hypothetical protein